jgi:hypothetical protein
MCWLCCGVLCFFVLLLTVALLCGAQDVPKQLKYSADTVSWSATDSQLMQYRFQMDEKTQVRFYRISERRGAV